MHAPLKDAAFYKLSKSILKIQSKPGKVALMTCCQALGAAITLRPTNTTHGQLRGMANYGAWPSMGPGQAQRICHCFSRKLVRHLVWEMW
jgi:hypothetical protein